MIRVAGHFGELLQGRLGASGPLALITLPCPGTAVTLCHQPGPFQLHQPGGPVLPRAHLQAVLRHCRQPLSGRWHLRALRPVGAGAGVSTAALLAVIRQAAPQMSAQAAQLLCLRIEGASDPLAFTAPERLLWASREGRVLGRAPRLPRLRVAGGFQGPGQRTNPRDLAFADIADLWQAWPAACATPQAIGALASRAAQRSLDLRAPGSFAPLAALASRFGALGVSIAYTGAARAFLLPPERDPGPLLAALRGQGWQHLQSYLIGGPSHG